MTIPPETPQDAPGPVERDSDFAEPTVEWLRAEHDANDDAVAQGTLLHEIGVLEEAQGDEAAAARDLLSAINVDPEFREPLEQLIVIIERRKSFKNLGKLLDRLTKVAENDDERARALVQLAAFLEDHQEDLDGARAALEEAVDAKPGDAAAWLALEVLAGKLDDADLRRRALAARAGIIGDKDAEWRSLVLVDLAMLQLSADDFDSALASLQQAIEAKGPATYGALQALERAGRQAGRDDAVSQALEAQSALILRAIDEGSTGDALGVPKHVREPAYAADAWLRAAEAHRRRGDVAAAASLLDKALERLAGEPILTHARLHAAEAAGDTQTAATLARKQLDAGLEGGTATSLWLRIAEAAAAEGDGPGALEALDKALAQDPRCIPARALQIDLLSGGQTAGQLASALEAAAAELGEDEAKARYYLLAADTWARLVRDPQGAKAALSQAGMYGTPGSTLARVGRLMAAVIDDATWYEESTRRLLAAGAPEGEQASLWFELGRLKLSRGDHAGATDAFKHLADAPGGAWLGQALTAYALVLAAPPPGDADDEGAAAADDTSALIALADAETDDNLSRALRMVVSLRHRAAGRTDEAIALLRELQEADPGDAIVSSQLSALLRAKGEPGAAADVLLSCAEATDDNELAAAFEIEGGMVKWDGGDRSAAVECFSKAKDRSAPSSAGLLAWALRAAEPNSLEARRRALEEAGDEAPPSAALERFGLEMGSDGDAAEAARALEAINGAPQDIQVAATLAKALWTAPDALPTDRVGALSNLAEISPGASILGRCSLHQMEIARIGSEPGFDPETLETSAARWAQVDPGLAAALEWLAAAVASNDVEREVDARRAVAARVDGDARAAFNASAATLSVLSGEESQPLLGGPHAQARLVDLELSQPGCDPRRRGTALAGLGDAMGGDATPVAQALAGWNHLAAGDVDSALSAFRAVVDAFPEDLIGWDGLRAAAEASGDRATVAEACAALGDAVHEDDRGAELWEAAAFILIDELGDHERGEFALGRAVARDVGRFDAFDRLFRIVRKRKDGPRLLELIEVRLEVADDPEEIAKLFWERARVLREAGDREGAMAALENVTMLEPDHVGALALSGEIYITLGKFPEAADNLARLATLDEAPDKQRLMSGVAAVDIYEKKLDNLPRALETLVALHDVGLSTPPVRERLARMAAKVEDWERATAMLEQLMMERDSSEGRAEAARLAMVIYRDRIGDASRAVNAVPKLLQERPEDGEALDVVLSGVLPADLSNQLLTRGRETTVQAVQQAPLDPERINRLAKIAGSIQDAPLRQATLGALVAVGHGTAPIDEELRTLDERVARTPQMAVDEAALPDLCHPDDRGPVPDLMRALAPTFVETLGPGLEAFGAGKRDRVKPNAGLPVRNEIAAWAGALGIGDFDLYVGGHDPDGVFGIPTSPPAIVIGPNVRAPLPPERRQLVARELFALRRGTTILRHRDPTDIAALVVAACKVGGVEVPSPAYAMLGEFERQLSKGMARKVKKLLPQLAEPVRQSGQDPLQWVAAATASLDRLASIAAGDVSYVLSALEGIPRGQLGASNESRERARRLLAFVLSPTYLALREQLGMGVR